MRILLAGGGSGGHVTPLRAISQSLQAAQPNTIELAVISDRGFFKQTQFLFSRQPDIRLKQIYSGKLRRYSSKSFLWHLVHLPTLLKNIRDVFLLAIGTLQSLVYIWRFKPAVVFCKGGFVCVPVGLAAHILCIPLIIHDSDTHPGLTNRFLSRWAITIGTGMPKKYYEYPATKMRYTGIPVNKDFQPVSKQAQKSLKSKLGFQADQPLLLVSGGSTGAKTLNEVVAACAERLLKAGWQIVHITGKGKAALAEETRSRLPVQLQSAWQITEFAELLDIVLAADLIVSRAGATALQEFANAAKPVIIVPSPHLTGGHQLKNAAMFADAQAAVVVQESELTDPAVLAQQVQTLSKNSQQMKTLADRLHDGFAKPLAAEELAQAIIEAAQLISA